MNRRYLLLLLLAAVMILSGCTSGTVTAEESVTEIEIFALLQQSTNRVFAYVHGDHWHGSLPAMNEGDTMPLNVFVEDIQEEQLTVDGETHALSAVIVAGDEHIVQFDFNAGVIQITAESPGEAQVVFQLQRDGVVYYEAPPTLITVLAPVEETVETSDEEDVAVVDGREFGSVKELDIIDRSNGQVVADIHGNHWHGQLPAVTAGSSISLGAVFEDMDGATIVLDGSHYALGAAIADGSDAIVRIQNNGDHVDVYGETAGETRIVFQLLHDGAIEYETPSIQLVVTNP